VVIDHGVDVGGPDQRGVAPAAGLARCCGPVLQSLLQPSTGPGSVTTPPAANGPQHDQTIYGCSTTCWQTVYGRRRRWNRDGTWTAALDHLRAEADHEHPT